MEELSFSCIGCEKVKDLRGAVVWEEVIGWERRRGQGGTNHVALRTKTGLLMCGACMTLRQAGIAPGQGTLV